MVETQSPIAIGSCDRFLLTSSAVVFNEFDGGRSEEVEQLAELIQSGKGPQMIVVDTVARSMSGDENTAKDTGGFIRAVDYLIDLARSQGDPLCVLLVHHSKKTGEEYRGSSAFRGAMDFEYRMVKKKGQRSLRAFMYQDERLGDA